MHQHHGFVSHLPYMFRNKKIHSPSSFDNSQIESLREEVTSILPVAVLLPLPQNCSNIRSEDSHITTWPWVPAILVTQSQQWRITENVSQQDRKGGKSELKEHNGSERVQSDKNCPLKVKFHNKKCFHTICDLKRPVSFLTLTSHCLHIKSILSSPSAALIGQNPCSIPICNRLTSTS